MASGIAPNQIMADLQEAHSVYQETGNYAETARRLETPVSTVKDRVRKYITLGLADGPGVKDAMLQTGVTRPEARHGWRRVQDEDGNWNSVFWKKQEADPVELADELREVFEGLKPIDPIKAPEVVMEDLCAVYPWSDIHLGLRAWSKETWGDDYDVKIAVEDMRVSSERLLEITPPAAEAVLIVNGDFLHADDNKNATPGSGHRLDVDSSCDGRMSKVARVGVELIDAQVQRLLQRHKNVTVRIHRGNHDEHSHLIVAFGLVDRFAKNERITLDFNERPLFQMQWGKCAIFAHHGDKPNRGDPFTALSLLLADVCRFWSETRFRTCFTGHVHKFRGQQVGGLYCLSTEAFCPLDGHAADQLYVGRRALRSYTFDKHRGCILEAFDPVRIS